MKAPSSIAIKHLLVIHINTCTHTLTNTHTHTHSEHCRFISLIQHHFGISQTIFGWRCWRLSGSLTSLESGCDWGTLWDDTVYDTSSGLSRGILEEELLSAESKLARLKSRFLFWFFENKIQRNLNQLTRRYMAEILPVRRKTLSNQSKIN